MAKLKIPDPSDPTNPDKASGPGYINVVNNLTANDTIYQNFVQHSAHDDERPSKLQGWAGTDGGLQCVVTHLTTGGVQEAITDDNCIIDVHIDRQKVHVRSKHNMSVPANRPTDFSYLTKYTQIIYDYVQAGDVVSANTFLFGLMLLTRCR